MLENGFFHADPHAGNLLALPNGKLCYLDFGMVRSIATLELAKGADKCCVARFFSRRWDDGIDYGGQAWNATQSIVVLPKVLTKAVLVDFVGGVEMTALITEEQTVSLLLVHPCFDSVVGWGATMRYE